MEPSPADSDSLAQVTPDVDQRAHPWDKVFGFSLVDVQCACIFFHQFVWRACLRYRCYRCLGCVLLGVGPSARLSFLVPWMRVFHCRDPAEVHLRAECECQLCRVRTSGLISHDLIMGYMGALQYPGPAECAKPRRSTRGECGKALER